MLSYDIPADLVDDCLTMGESQAIMCVKRFAVGIMQVFGQEYFEISQCWRSRKAIGDEQSSRLPTYAWLNRLHALELEELSKGMAWAISRPKKGFHYNP